MQLPLQACKLVPAFNEADVLARVTEEPCREAPAGLLLVVDDASSDDTGAVAAHASATVIRHRINRGQEAALQPRRPTPTD